MNLHGPTVLPHSIVAAPIPLGVISKPRLYALDNARTARGQTIMDSSPQPQSHNPPGWGFRETAIQRLERTKPFSPFVEVSMGQVLRPTPNAVGPSKLSRPVVTKMTEYANLPSGLGYKLTAARRLELSSPPELGRADQRASLQSIRAKAGSLPIPSKIAMLNGLKSETKGSFTKSHAWRELKTDHSRI